MKINWIKYNSKVNLVVGSIVKDKDGKVFLIGDFNTNLGGCDCCGWSIEYYSNDLVTTFLEIKNKIDE